MSGPVHFLQSHPTRPSVPPRACPVWGRRETSDTYRSSQGPWGAQDRVGFGRNRRPTDVNASNDRTRTGEV